jgi:hypothetical protein
MRALVSILFPMFACSLTALASTCDCSQEQIGKSTQTAIDECKKRSCQGSDAAMCLETKTSDDCTVTCSVCLCIGQPLPPVDPYGPPPPGGGH